MCERVSLGVNLKKSDKEMNDKFETPSGRRLQGWTGHAVTRNRKCLPVGNRPRQEVSQNPN